MILGDFHIHSTFSDGEMTIPEIVDFYGLRGFGAIAITDHLCEEKSMIGRAAFYLDHTLTRASFPMYIEILKSEAVRAWEQYRMVLISGVELTKNSISNHRSAHILALGVNNYISADGDALSLLKSIRSQGAVSVAAHPVSTRKTEKQTYHLWNRREELRPYFDAWEVASGCYLFPEVLNSNLPRLANSDLHYRKQMSSWKTIIHSEKHPEAILQAIRDQQMSLTYYYDNNIYSAPTLIGSERERAYTDDLGHLFDAVAL